MGKKHKIKSINISYDNQEQDLDERSIKVWVQEKFSKDLYPEILTKDSSLKNVYEKYQYYSGNSFNVDTLIWLLKRQNQINYNERIDDVHRITIRENSKDTSQYDDNKDDEKADPNETNDLGLSSQWGFSTFTLSSTNSIDEDIFFPSTLEEQIAMIVGSDELDFVDLSRCYEISVDELNNDDKQTLREKLLQRCNNEETIEKKRKEYEYNKKTTNELLKICISKCYLIVDPDYNNRTEANDQIEVLRECKKFFTKCLENQNINNIDLDKFIEENKKKLKKIAISKSININLIELTCDFISILTEKEKEIFVNCNPICRKCILTAKEINIYLDEILQPTIGAEILNTLRFHYFFNFKLTKLEYKEPRLDSNNYEEKANILEYFSKNIKHQIENINETPKIDSSITMLSDEDFFMYNRLNRLYEAYITTPKKKKSGRKKSSV